MLKRAFLYKPQLERLFTEACDLTQNRFYISSHWVFEPEIDNNNESKHQFVSLDKGDNVVGYFEAEVLSKQHFIQSMSAIRFLKNNYYNHLFSKDFFDFFAKLFMFYNYRKICYEVAIGSPNEKWYDKYTEKYGGRVVGVRKKHFCLENGGTLDVKLYEIFKEDYMNNFSRNHPAKFKQYKMELL